MSSSTATTPRRTRGTHYKTARDESSARVPSGLRQPPCMQYFKFWASYNRAGGCQHAVADGQYIKCATCRFADNPNDGREPCGLKNNPLRVEWPDPTTDMTEGKYDGCTECQPRRAPPPSISTSTEPR
jgi:hypothetical protein